MKLNILQDRFIIGVIVAVVVLLLFFLWGVKGKWSEIEELRTLIKGKDGEETLNLIKRIGVENPNDLPTRPKIDAYVNYGKNLDEEYKKCLEFYRKSDEAIEKWFDDISLKDGLPSEGPFIATYNKVQRESILQPLENHNPKISIVNEQNEEVLVDEDKLKILGAEELSSDPNIFKARVRKVQKQFWIQKKIVESLISAEVIKCGEIKFPKTSAPTADGLGTTIPWEVTVYLHYKNVSRLIHQISDSSKGGPFIFIRGVKISRFSKQGEDIKEEIKLEQDRGRWTPPSNLPEIKVVITGSAIDFDIK